MEEAKKIGGAFVVGGLIGALTQVFFVIAKMLVGDESAPAMIVALVFLGVVTVVLILTNLYAKVEKVGYFGAVLPFSGLISAVCHLYHAGNAEGGVLKGIASGLSLLIFILGAGTVICLIIGAVYSFVLPQ